MYRDWIHAVTILVRTLYGSRTFMSFFDHHVLHQAHLHAQTKTFTFSPNLS